MSDIRPVLRQMIDNNKPHWRPGTIRGAHRMLDKYEAKAGAFDRIVKESKGAFSCGDFCDDVRHIINSYEIGVDKDD